MCVSVSFFEEGCRVQGLGVQRSVFFVGGVVGSVNRPRVVPLAAGQLSLEHASASCLELEILSHKSEDNEIVQETGTTITTNCISLSKALQHISSKKLHVY